MNEIYSFAGLRGKLKKKVSFQTGLLSRVQCSVQCIALENRGILIVLYILACIHADIQYNTLVLIIRYLKHINIQKHTYTSIKTAGHDFNVSIIRTFINFQTRYQTHFA